MAGLRIGVRLRRASMAGLRILRGASMGGLRIGVRLRVGVWVLK